MLNTIGSIGSLVGLLFAIVVAFASFRRRRLLNQGRLIEGSTGAERSRYVDEVLFQVATDPGLTKQQRYNIAMDLIARRGAKFRWIIGASVVMAILPLLVVVYTYKLASQEDLYRVRVAVLGTSGVPVEDAKVWSSFGGEPKQVAGGWQFDIPDSSKPTGPNLRIFAERGFLTGSVAVALGDDRNVTAEIQLTKPLASIRGTVIDPSGATVAGALVSVSGYGDEAVTTQEDGSFALPAHASPGEDVRLHVEHSDFLPTDQYHPAGGTPATIVLRRPEPP